MSEKKQPRFPAEWEEHEATILAFPHNRNDWPGKFAAVKWVYAEIIRKLAASEPILLIVQDEKQQREVERLLIRASADATVIKWLVQPTDRSWMRDTSPFFVLENGKRRAVHFAFDGWSKYDNYLADSLAPAAVSRALKTRLKQAKHGKRHVVLEGGAVDSNGRGVLLTTEECLLSPDVQVRNEGFTRDDYEKVFKEYLGIEQTVWLGRGIGGDDTHGHVDDLCRFVNEYTVVLCRESNMIDENYTALEENAERLQDVRLRGGGRLEVIDLPMPDPLFYDGIRLPASYANFYIGNEVVLVPTFNDENDRVALGILGELFPTRKVVGIHAVELVWGFGTLHCLTHEVPAV